jgi:uncharacterized membrane protein
MAVHAITLWNTKIKVWLWAVAAATFCAILYTVSSIVFFLGPPTYRAHLVIGVLGTIGYWMYIPAEYTVMYNR